MSPHQLDELTDHLDTLRIQNDQAKHQHRRQQALAAGKKPHLPRSGRPLQLGFPDRVLATVLHRRLQLPHDVLAVLFHSHRSTIRRAVTEVRQLLHQHGTTITPAALPPAATALLRTATNRHYPGTEIKAAS
nr:transposase family protein [Actinoplanes derwentensis]